MTRSLVTWLVPLILTVPVACGGKAPEPETPTDKHAPTDAPAATTPVPEPVPPPTPAPADTNPADGPDVGPTPTPQSEE